MFWQKKSAPAANNAGKKSGSVHLLSNLLHGLVDTSMTVVNIANLTSRIKNSASQVHDLVSTTASAGEEMSATVKGIAENTQQASSAAQQANSEAMNMVETLGRVMDDMTSTSQTINSLQEASDKVQDVVNTIHGISDQTNLLALNAAIEAARAGDAGRGFAVVAEEVRKLSNMTQNSTVEIVEMLSRIQKDVTAAVASAQQAQSSVQDGVEGANRLQQNAANIEDIMSNIARSTQEQSEASEQISNSMLSVSEQAAENSQQSSHIMELLDDLSGLVEEQRATLAEEKIPSKVITLAQADHALWKKKIVDFQMGRIDLTPEQAGDHTKCRLGVWYYGDGAKNYAGNPDYTAVEDPHMKVHQAARTAAERRAENPNADISDLVAELEDASNSVVEHLKNLTK